MRGSRSKRKGFWSAKKIAALFLSIFIFFNNVLPVIAATFTPSLAKREGPGPFAAAPIVQGDPNNLSSLTDDVLSSSRGTQVSGNFYSNFDGTQGSVVLWFTPEFSYDALSGSADHYIWYISSNYFLSYEYDNDRYNLTVGGQSMTVSSNIAAGTTYNLVSRWDTQNIIQGSNYAGLSINDSHTFGVTTAPTAASADSTIYLGTNGTTGASSAIIEGLTVYRRVLYDGTNGINAGNGDEVALIYNSGTGTDPTRVTGSWDVVFNLPTNSSTGALTTGTGEAWSHPSTSNLTYTSTTNTGGYMLNGTYSSDGFYPSGALTPIDGTGSSLDFERSDMDYVRATDSATLDITGAITIEGWFYFESLAEEALVNKNLATGNQRGYNFSTHFTNTDEIYIGLSQTGTGVSYLETTSNANLATDTWYHLAVVWTPSQKATFYKNGVQLTSTTDVGTPPPSIFSNTADLFIGAFNSGSVNDLDGKANNIRVWARALTPSEIRDNMYYLTGSTNSLRAWWKFNEGSGQEAFDSSGNHILALLGGSYDPTSQDPTWSTSQQSPTISALSSSEKIYPGGYKYTSDGSDQGIYITETVSAGDDWVVRALANSDGTSNPKIELWDITHNQPIATQSGTTTSTRTAPNTFVFTGEAPTAMTTLGVKILNSASSGVTYWHQLEVLTNLVNNPSLEGTYAGTPPIPPNWTNANLDAGDTEAETTIVHSGLESLQFNATAASDELLSVNVTSTIGKYYGTGLFAYGDGTTAPGIRMAANPQWNFNNGTDGAVTYGSNAASWQHIPVVWRRASGAAQTFRIYAANSAVAYADDGYAYELNDVSLTATPASEANSTESTGLRVDGRDSYVESSQADQTTTSGFVSFNWTPRHSSSTAVSFAETSSDDAYILTLNGDADDYIRLYWDSANTLNLAYSMNGTTASDTWDATGAISPNTTYAAILEYTGSGDMTLSIDGTDRITLSSIPAAFGVAPDDVYFGSDASSSNQGDGVYGDIVFVPTSTPTPTPTPSGGSSSSSSSQSSSSAPTSCTNQPPVSPPSIFAGTSTQTSATLYFSPAGTPLTGYNIRFGTKPGEYTYGALNIADKNATNITVNLLVPGVTYYFQIQGRNSCMAGGWSNEFSVKTKGLTLNPIPKQTYEIVDVEIEEEVVIVEEDEIIEVIEEEEIIDVDTQGVTATAIPTPTNTPTPTPIPDPIEEVTITVKDTEDNPVGGAKVILHSDPKEGVTNENGEVTFKEVERGEHTLIVQHNLFSGEQKLNLTGDKDYFNISITINPKTNYTGTITAVAVGLIGGIMLMTVYNRLRRKT